MSSQEEIFNNLEIYYRASTDLRTKFAELFEAVKNSEPPSPFTFKIAAEGKLEEDYFLISFAGLTFDLRFSVDVDLEEGTINGVITIYDLNNDEGDEFTVLEYSQTGLFLNDESEEDRDISGCGYVVICELLNEYIYASFDLEEI